MATDDLRAEEDLFSDAGGDAGNGAEELTAPVSAPDGPANPEESHRFCSRFFERLAVVELGGEHPGLQQCLVESLQHGLTLTTDYSGLGTAEEAMRQIVEACQAHVACEMVDPLSQAAFASHHATDVDKHCRSILMHHAEPWRPQCLFRDILERTPDFAQKLLESERLEILDEIGLGEKSRKRKAPGTFTSAIAERGRGFIQKAVTLLLKNMPKDGPKALCGRHARNCCVNPAVPLQSELGPKPLILHVSGFNCYDWSSMGVGLKFLGPSSLPFAQWVAERKRFQEPIVVAECTMNFDFFHLQKMMEPEYPSEKSFALRVSPVMLGEPVERVRMYMFFLSNEMTWRQSESVERQTAGWASDLFVRIFHHNVVMSPCDKFQSPEQMVRDFIKKTAMKQHLPPSTSSGKEWSFVQACSSAVQEKIEMHNAWLHADLAANEMVFEPENWVCNLSQTPAFMAPSYKKVPCLLRGSHLYLFKQKRCALELELLEVQGWCMFDTAAPAGVAVGQRGSSLVVLLVYFLRLTNSFALLGD
ncbi:unnamed protein product [Symbiodinium sp. CCMP2592]|nr:unnamed protein product [Symbiodinium sp. CCMP2592]